MNFALSSIPAYKILCCYVIVGMDASTNTTANIFFFFLVFLGYAGGSLGIRNSWETLVERYCRSWGSSPRYLACAWNHGCRHECMTASTNTYFMHLYACRLPDAIAMQFAFMHWLSIDSRSEHVMSMHVLCTHIPCKRSAVYKLLNDGAQSV